jgi:hypothetical protein
MAHLPLKNLPAFDPFSQPKTLFLPAPGELGFLVERKGVQFKAREKKFAGPEAALAWCIKYRVGLVYYFSTETVSRN